MAWHSDNEKALGTHPVIASVSFGQVRCFDIRRKSEHSEKYSIRLESGALMIMKGDLQVKLRAPGCQVVETDGAKGKPDF